MYVRGLTEAFTPEVYFTMPVPTSIIVIGCGSSTLIPHYKAATNCPWPIYADPTRKLYKSFGMTWTLTPGPRPAYCGDMNIMEQAWGQVVQQYRIGPKKSLQGGQPFQIGGEFLFEDGRVVWCHRMRNFRDHSEVADVKRVLEQNIGYSMSEEEDEEEEEYPAVYETATLMSTCAKPVEMFLPRHSNSVSQHATFFTQEFEPISKYAMSRGMESLDSFDLEDSAPPPIPRRRISKHMDTEEDSAPPPILRHRTSAFLDIEDSVPPPIPRRTTSKFKEMEDSAPPPIQRHRTSKFHEVEDSAPPPIPRRSPFRWSATDHFLKPSSPLVAASLSEIFDYDSEERHSSSTIRQITTVPSIDSLPSHSPDESSNDDNESYHDSFLDSESEASTPRNETFTRHNQIVRKEYESELSRRGSKPPNLDTQWTAPEEEENPLSDCAELILLWQRSI
jgi:hypothetical protein